MRKRHKTLKLKRSVPHRKSMMANQVCSLIEHKRIRTTLAKAKALRPFAEKLVTIGKKDTVHARRLAKSYLRSDKGVKGLFEEIAPACKQRQGGYCRIVKLGLRASDAAPMAIIEWVDFADKEAEVATAE